MLLVHDTLTWAWLTWKKEMDPEKQELSEVLWENDHGDTQGPNNDIGSEVVRGDLIPTHQHLAGTICKPSRGSNWKYNLNPHL